jgi:hypothetical protein
MIDSAQSVTERELAEDLHRAMSARRSLLPPQVELKKGDVKNGLGKLVLTIVELLR